MSNCSKCGTQLTDDSAFCHRCGQPAVIPSQSSNRDDVDALRRRLDELRDVVNTNADLLDVTRDRIKAIEKHSFMSNNFWTRAWAVWWHAVAPGFIFSVGFYMLLLMLAALGG